MTAMTKDKGDNSENQAGDKVMMSSNANVDSSKVSFPSGLKVDQAIKYIKEMTTRGGGGGSGGGGLLLFILLFAITRV